MGRTLRYEVTAGCMVLVHGQAAPSAAEWTEYVQAVDAERSRELRVLVVTDEPGPDTVQRAKLNEAVARRGRAVPTAVMTRSRVARGIVTALGWFNPSIRAFAPSELSAAMAHLALDPASRDALVQCVARMRLELAMGDDARSVDVAALSVEQLARVLSLPLVALRGGPPQSTG